MLQYHEELLTVTYNIFKFAEQSTEEIREQVGVKISMLNNKTEAEREKLRNTLIGYADR